jgi:low affinity Fe/Cu permease
MAETIRQQIVTAVETRLKTILVANGYRTAVGANVFLWRDSALTTAELPGMILRDRKAPVEVVSMQHQDNNLKFEVECYAKGATTAAQGRLMLDDVVKCIGVDQTWGRLARYTLLDSHEIDLDQNAETIGGVKIEFTVVYRTNQWTT